MRAAGSARGGRGEALPGAARRRVDRVHAVRRCGAAIKSWCAAVGRRVAYSYIMRAARDGTAWTTTRTRTGRP